MTLQEQMSVCETCVHRHDNPDGGWCYMMDSPLIGCLQLEPLETKKGFIATGKSRQAKVIHAGRDCPWLKEALDVKEVDPATLRVFVRCKYCFG